MGVTEQHSTGCAGPTGCDFSYVYDDQGRLDEVWEGGVLKREYTYDANGNRLSLIKHDGGSTTVESATTIGVRDQVEGYGDRTNINYNDDGQTTGWDEPGAAVALSYDRADHLLEVSKSGASGFNVKYRYDAVGRRVERLEDNTTTHRWVWRGSQLIAEYDANLVLRKQFVYAEFPHVPSVIIDYSSGSAVKYRVVHDQLGSVRKVVSMADGTVAQELKYDEFGRVEHDSDAGFQPFGFAGGLYDNVTELTRFGVRDYDPYLGRWS